MLPRRKLQKVRLRASVLIFPIFGLGRFGLSLCAIGSFPGFSSLGHVSYANLGTFGLKAFLCARVCKVLHYSCQFSIISRALACTRHPWWPFDVGSLSLCTGPHPLARYTYDFPHSYELGTGSVVVVAFRIYTQPLFCAGDTNTTNTADRGCFRRGAEEGGREGRGEGKEERGRVVAAQLLLLE